MKEFEDLKKKILTEYPRLSPRDRFRFECGPDLECFNVCCSDVNIFLTPYDVLMMRKALDMDSTRFLAEYTIVPFDKNQKLPVPLLKMRDTERKECRFVDTRKGCKIYEHRPWPCRIYPLGAASPGETEVNAEPFYFLIQEGHCKGHERAREWTVDEWLEDQGISEYAEFGELFKKVTLHPAFTRGRELAPQQIDMYWTALYDLDKFRRFIFESSFLKRFEITEPKLDELKVDDVSLLRFGFDWIRFAMFGEKRVKVRPDAEKWIKGEGVKPGVANA
ncbi:MAG TPA: YkgJ family cysteine cluster protein [Bacteroidetes bacterium]|nr:YkgJ family cysteine cluster protein [Bacteroidota bacterium]